MNRRTIIILILLLLAILGGGYFYTQQTGDLEPQSDALQQAEEYAEDALDERGVEAEEDVDAYIPSPLACLDSAAASEARILGDASAPIRITEHSSFTCGHCGKFHKESFKDVKTQLVDTGKAYIVFSDFPLNAPALHASMVARCIPDQTRYFDFVQMLFEDQENWAYERNYLEILKNKSEEYGLSDQCFKACLENEELQQSIVAGAKAAQAQFNVSSTPSFVVNNKTLISGAVPTAEFITKVNEAVSTPVEVAPEVPSESDSGSEQP